MFLVAVTGGIASGKSTVCRIFRDLGCPIIDADVIARQVVEPDNPAWRKIRQHFGPEVFHSDGQLNRDALGQIIFADESSRKLLNSITHPHIYRRILYELLIHFMKGEQFVVLDLPLLFESGALLPFINTTVVVYCERNEQIERLRARNGYSEEIAIQRISAQMPLELKCEKATCVIDNCGKGEQVRDQVLALHAKLRNSKVHWKLRCLLVLVLSVPVFGVLYSRL